MRDKNSKPPSSFDLKIAAGREKGNVVDVQLLDLTVNLGTHPPSDSFSNLMCILFSSGLLINSITNKQKRSNSSLFFFCQIFGGTRALLNSSSFWSWIFYFSRIIYFCLLFGILICVWSGLTAGKFPIFNLSNRFTVLCPSLFYNEMLMRRKEMEQEESKCVSIPGLTVSWQLMLADVYFSTNVELKHQLGTVLKSMWLSRWPLETLSWSQRLD